MVLSLFFTKTSLRYLRETVEYTEHSSFQQTSQLLEYYISNVNDNVNSLLGQEEFHKILEKNNEGTTIQEQLADMYSIRRILNVCSSKREINDVRVYVDNQAVYIGSNSQIQELLDVEQEPWYEYVEKSYPDSVMIPGSYLENPSSVGYAKAIRSARNYSRMIGIVFFELNQNLLSSYLGDGSAALVFLVNERGEMVAKNNAACPDVSAETLELCADEEAHTIRIGKEEYMLYAKKLEYTDWYLVYLEHSSIMGRLIWQQGAEYAAIFIVILLMGLVFFGLFFRLCLNRITAMTRHMSGIRTKLPPPMETGKRKDEITELVLAYNYMLGRVNDLMKEQYELGNQIKEIEMKALYEQINPHFLYNTLTMINWLAEDGQTEDVTKVITALSSFYRLSLNKGNENISLSEELEIAKNFVYIQQMRFGTDIRLECSMDAIYGQFVLPKLTLQPLIENALVHGILKRRDKSGVIAVGVSDRDGFLVIEVSDNGVGMDRETAEKLNNGTIRSEKTHYGVWNIVKRASLFYKAPCRLSCSSEPGQGTTMVLALPYRERG